MGMGPREIVKTGLEIEARGADQAAAEIDKVTQHIHGLAKASANTSLKLFAAGMIFDKAGQMIEAAGRKMFTTAEGMIKQSMEFDKSMRLVNTIARQTPAAFEDMKQGVLDVFSKTPQSVKSLTDALYDLWSSVDTNGPQSVEMLEAVSKAATAGGTDVQSAIRAVIPVMNAYEMSTQDLNKILDIQFRMVERGVGTYTEFANAFGNLVPYAKVAGQSVEEMSGALAFLTRRLGISVPEAVTAVSRAFDFISRPKVRKALKETLGIETVDKATGKYKQMNIILEEMSGKLGKMSQPQQRETLTKIFGNGAIRAMKFFNVAIPGWKDYRQEVENVTDSQGAMNKAFNEMAKSPGIKAQIAWNRLLAIGIKMADTILPLLVEMLKPLEALMRYLEEMDPKTKNVAMKILLFGGALLMIIGPLMQFAGGLLSMVSLAMLAEVPLTLIAGILAAIVGVTALAGGGMAWFVKKLEKGQKASDKAAKGFNNVKTAFDKLVYSGSAKRASQAIDKVEKRLKELYKRLAETPKGKKRTIIQTEIDRLEAYRKKLYAVRLERFKVEAGIKAFNAAIEQMPGSKVMEDYLTMQKQLPTYTGLATDSYKTFNDTVVASPAAKVISDMGGDIDNIQASLGDVVYVMTPWEKAWETIKGIISDVKKVWDDFYNTMKPAIDILTEQLKKDWGPAWDEIKALWVELKPMAIELLYILGGLLTMAVGMVLALAGAVAGALPGILQMIRGVVQFFKGIIQFWKGVRDIIVGLITIDPEMVLKGFKGILNGIKNIFGGILNVIVGAVRGWIGSIIGFTTTVYTYFRAIYTVLTGKHLPDIVKGVKAWWAKLPGIVSAYAESIKQKAIQGFVKAVNWIINSLPGQLVSALGAAMLALWRTLVTWAEKIHTKIVWALNPKSKGSPSMLEALETGLTRAQALLNKVSVPDVIHQQMVSYGNQLAVAATPVRVNTVVQSPQVIIKFQDDRLKDLIRVESTDVVNQTFNSVDVADRGTYYG